MVRVRTPFFFPIFLLAFLFGIGLTCFLDTTVDPSLAMENWIRDASKRVQFRDFMIAIAAISAFCLSILGILEYQIWKGWEPRGLRRMITGVLVTDLYDDLLRPNFMWIEVEFAEGYRDMFSLDPSETSDFKVGDRIHLWVIGKHVTHGRVLEPSPYITDGNPFSKGHRPRSKSAGAWILMCTSPLIAGFIFGIGIEHALFMEMVLPTGGKRNRSITLETGPLPLFYGVMCMGVALFVLGNSAYRWKAGWDNKSILEGDYRPDGWN